jgi:hypothetical protein
VIAHPLERAPEMLRFYRDAVADCPDDLTVFAGLTHAPDGSGTKFAVMAVFHTGDAEQAERDLAPFEEWGSPVVVEVGPMPYPVMNTLLDEGFPAGTASSLREHLDDRRWLNYLGDDQGTDAVRAAYGPNYARLVEVKRRYDPDNVFRHNHNIDPA